MAYSVETLHALCEAATHNVSTKTGTEESDAIRDSRKEVLMDWGHPHSIVVGGNTVDS